VSEWCRERIAKALSDEAAARMVRLSPGVDTDRFYPGCGGEKVRERYGIPPDAPVVVCVARMVRRKGQDTLVKAWPRVLEALPEARLLLVGDGPYRRAVERLARRLGVEDSVVFTGSVGPGEVPAHIDAGDVFAMPCRSRLLGLEAEAFGIVYLEAAACGVPVLTGDSGGAPEAVCSVGTVCAGAHTREVADIVVSTLRGRGVTPEGQRQLVVARTWETVGGEFRRCLQQEAETDV
jgi:phosphatidylinositol alpha-1,6-mannosyltransferase